MAVPLMRSVGLAVTVMLLRLYTPGLTKHARRGTVFVEVGSMSNCVSEWPIQVKDRVEVSLAGGKGVRDASGEDLEIVYIYIMKIVETLKFIKMGATAVGKEII